MLEAFEASSNGTLREVTVRGEFDLSDEVVWVDLIAPTSDEQDWVTHAYQQTFPTLKSLEDISSSARFYRNDDGVLHISTYYLTKNRHHLIEDPDEDTAHILATTHTVAFILHKNRIFTLRSHKMLAFRAFRARAHRNDYEVNYGDPVWILLGLLEAKLDELADILEDVHRSLEIYTTEVLNNHHREANLDLDDMVTRLAQQEDVLGKAQLCLMDLRRVLTFLSRPRALGSNDYDLDVREMNEDVRSLVEHNAFLFQKVRFLLDTTSGFINTEQNDIIKRFSVISSMLAPPMLISGIFGMNVHGLPFVDPSSVDGFWITMLIIVVCTLIPVSYFRYRKWL